jgi:hypothetical protein
MKLPIGLEPNYIWKARRVSDIVSAMNRYTEADVEIPLGWVYELTGLLSGLDGQKTPVKAECVIEYTNGHKGCVCGACGEKIWSGDTHICPKCGTPIDW